MIISKIHNTNNNKGRVLVVADARRDLRLRGAEEVAELVLA